MPNMYEAIYSMLSDEPVTLNEIAKKLGVTHKNREGRFAESCPHEEGHAPQELGENIIFWKVKR